MYHDEHPDEGLFSNDMGADWYSDRGCGNGKVLMGKG